MKEDTEKLVESLKMANVGISVLELPEPAARSSDAARLVGCDIHQIAKSIVFMAEDGSAVLVVANGGDRINEEAVGRLVGGKVRKAEPSFVEETTGFEIGGVPPLRTAKIGRVIFDRKLLSYGRIWAACGDPSIVFSTDPRKLVDYDAAEIATVS